MNSAGAEASRSGTKGGLTMREVKQEVEEGQATAGAGAMVAVQVAAPVVDLEVRIEKGQA